MKTRALTSCTAGGLICLSTSCVTTAFVSSTTPALSRHHRHHRTRPSVVVAAAATPRSLLPPATMKLSGRPRRHTRGLRRTRMAEDSGSDGVVNMSSFDAQSAPSSGPGAGVIDLQFQNLKTGGFKVFLLFFLLGQGRAKDNDTPFSVRDTEEGIRVLIGDETKNDSQWEGVLDLSWGVEPRPFFRVDRIDVNEVIPYPGELYILNKLLDAIIDVNGEQSVEDHQKLFMFREGEQNQLAETKAMLAGMASL
ncbi:unnamed protein product [Ectocarpus sp. 6 AP-2014]